MTHNRQTPAYHERACLQAAIDFFAFTPAEVAEWAPRFDEPRMCEMRDAAHRVLRERIRELKIEPHWEEE